ncbi:MAG: GatB/YqeY domain-containing protein [Caldilineaceae bacterium]
MADTTKLTERLENDLKQAMRDRNELVKLTLRAVKTALTEVAKPNTIHDLPEAEVITIMRKEAKRRRDSAEEFVKAGSQERADAELAEKAVIDAYLPTQMDEAAIETLARAAIAESGATSAKEMGKVMALLMPRTAGQADGKTVNAVVKRLLTS